MSVYKTQYWCSQGKECLYISRGQGRRVLASVVAAELEADDTTTYADLPHYCSACQLVFCSLQCKLHVRLSNKDASGRCTHYNSKGKAYSPQEIIDTSKADRQRYEAHRKSGNKRKHVLGSGAAPTGREQATHKRQIEKQQEDSEDEDAAAAAMLQLNTTQQQITSSSRGQQGQQQQRQQEQQQQQRIAPPMVAGAAAAAGPETRPALQESKDVIEKRKRVIYKATRVAAEEPAAVGPAATAAEKTLSQQQQQQQQQQPPSRRSQRLLSSTLAAAVGSPAAGTASNTIKTGSGAAAMAAVALQQLGRGDRHRTGQARTAQTGAQQLAAAAAIGGWRQRVHGMHVGTSVQSGGSILTQLDHLVEVAAAAANKDYATDRREACV